MKELLGIFGFAALYVGATGVSPVPSPQPSNLPEIARVRSTTICGILRDRIMPAMQRLAGADSQLQTGKLAFLNMGRNQVAQSRPALQLDEVHVEFAVKAMLDELGKMHDLLRNPNEFPKSPQTDDGKTAAALKAQIEAVEAQHQMAINVMNGTIESDRLGEMQHEGMQYMMTAIGPGKGESATPTPAPTREPTSFIGYAGLPTPPDIIVDPRSVEARNLGADTLYGKLAGALYDRQLHIVQLETSLTAAVAVLAKSCPPPIKPTKTP
jgi:hypothetical protein